MTQVYFVSYRRRPGEIKIGETDGPFRERAKSGQTWLGKGHTLHLLIPGRDREWHERFAKQRVEGEWFRLDGELAGFVNSHQSVVAQVKWRPAFQPTGRGGGSRKGKPSGRWPLHLKIAADALWIREAGSVDTILAHGGHVLSSAELHAQMDAIWPGWKDEAPESETDKAKGLNNRVYKMYYSGSSDKQRGAPRRAVSREHWARSPQATPELREMHTEIVRMPNLRPVRRPPPPAASPSLLSALE